MTDPARFHTDTTRSHPAGTALTDILAAATRAADPAAQIRRVLQRDGKRVQIGDELLTPARVMVLAVGKAAPAMAAAAAHVLGELLSHGLVVYKDPDPSTPQHPRLTYHQAGHPVPDARSCAAGVAALALIAAAKPADLVLVLLSGGGSALLVDLAPGVTLPMLQQLTGLLLASGADIGAINTVRRRVDQVKGGGLLRAAAHTQLRTLILSDVIGNSLTAIASGPTVPNPDAPDAAIDALTRAGIVDQVDPAIVTACRRPLAVQPVAYPPIIIADITQSLTAAAAAARQAGYVPTIVDAALQGDAPTVGAALAQHIRALPPAVHPRCLLWGGETTVTLPADHGHGGRNQSLALAIAQGIAGAPACLVACYATDGGDGPTDAAGAVVDPTTWERANRMGLDPATHLSHHNAYPLFAALGDLLLPGPTGTNVNDVVVVLVPSLRE